MLKLKCIECSSETRKVQSEYVCLKCGKKYPEKNNVAQFLSQNTSGTDWQAFYDQKNETKDGFEINDYHDKASFRAHQNAVQDLIKVPDKGTVLDIGCGSGFFSQGLTENAEVYGIDISVGMLRHASQKKIHAFQAGAEKLPFFDASFDVVMCIGVLHCIADPEPVLKDAFRVLKKGGMAVFISTNGNSFVRWLAKPFEKELGQWMTIHTIPKVKTIVSKHHLGKLELYSLIWPLTRVFRHHPNSLFARFGTTSYIIRLMK